MKTKVEAKDPDERRYLTPFLADLDKLTKKTTSFTTLLKRMLTETVNDEEMPKAISHEDDIIKLNEKIKIFADQQGLSSIDKPAASRKRKSRGV